MANPWAVLMRGSEGKGEVFPMSTYVELDGSIEYVVRANSSGRL
jgi:hypothetical protein